MKRLHFLVEGPTEKEFVDNLFLGHFAQFGVICDARLITTSRDWSKGKFYKGGIVSYGKLNYEIVESIKSDHGDDSYFTTFLDFYGLPGDFPGVKTATSANPRVAVSKIENALLSDIKRILPSYNVAGHFIPNIMCHEFETLVLADVMKLECVYLDYRQELLQLASQVSQIGDPELVNSSPDTAPSKRIEKLIPEYDKATAGPLAALAIGLSALRQKCTHFNDWVTKLEGLQ